MQSGLFGLNAHHVMSKIFYWGDREGASCNSQQQGRAHHFPIHFPYSSRSNDLGKVVLEKTIGHLRSEVKATSHKVSNEPNSGHF